MPENTASEEMVSVPRRFLFEAITGISVFLIIAVAAVGLSFLVTLLENFGVDNVIVIGLKCAEYLIFLFDLVLFGRFLWVTFKKTWKELK